MVTKINKISNLNFNQNLNVKIKITIRICMTRANLFCQWHSGTTFCLGNTTTKLWSDDFLCTYGCEYCQFHYPVFPLETKECDKLLTLIAVIKYSTIASYLVR